MCIDLFRFAGRIDIPFLFEQIWFDIQEEKPTEDKQITRHLRVTEVYDVLVKNPEGCPPLTELWALFPNDCLKEDTFQIRAVRVVPPGADDSGVDNYDWPYKGPPRWKNGAPGIVVRDCLAESQDIFGEAIESLEGIALTVGEIGFPNIFRELDNTREGDRDRSEDIKKCKEVLAGDNVKKCLVRIPFFEPHLQPGQTGWLRLVVKPVNLDASPAKPKTLPVIRPAHMKSDDYVLYYEQRLEVICPLLIRDRLYTKLRGDDHAVLALKVFLEELAPKGTSTRIGDHRIALLIPNDGTMEIYDTQCTTKGALFYGILDQKRIAQTAFLWACGSFRNADDDLVHNTMRVIDRLARFAGQKEDNVKTQLAPSGKYEAFALLVNQMKRVGLIENVEGENGKRDILALASTTRYDEANVPSEDDFDFNALRRIYAEQDVREHDKRLLKGFTDLHPFRVFFRIVWIPPVGN